MIDVRAFISKHEGVRSKVYLDSLGIPTIGVGFNLKRDGAREALAQVNADIDALIAGKAELTQAQIDALLDTDIAECVKDLHVLFPGFMQMPDQARAVLIDLRFNLGPTRLRGFKNTLAAFKRGDYTKACAGLATSLWAKQVGKRATENIALLKTIGAPNV